MKKIFITGGTGFIGRNFREQLAGFYNVTAPTSQELNLLDDAHVSGFLKKGRFDVVIHTATWNATRNSPKDLTKVAPHNLKMFMNIAEHNDLYGKMIYFGSGAEYDMLHYVPKMKEEYFGTHVPEDDYGSSKYIMTQYAQNARNLYNLRIFGVFGKYEDWEIRFISNACCKAVWDLPITMKQNAIFDYLSIDDLMNILKWFIENEPDHKVYNVCSGESRELINLARNVVAASGKRLDVVLKKEGIEKEYTGDNSRLLTEIGGYSFAPIDNAIANLYAWYAQNKNSIDRNKLLMDK